jgi:hypothetical protein
VKQGAFQIVAFGPGPKGGKVFLYDYSVFCMRALKDLSCDNFKCTRETSLRQLIADAHIFEKKYCKN